MNYIEAYLREIRRGRCIVSKRVRRQYEALADDIKRPNGFNMVRCIQGAKTLSLPMQMLGADLKAKKINYNNSSLLKWCLTNTGIQEDRNGNIVPIKAQSPKYRIDGTASLLDAYVGLYEHFNEFLNAL